MHRDAGGVGFLHGAVVAEDHQGEEALFQAARLVQAVLDQWRGLVVKHHEIRVLARLQAADPVVQIERAGAAQGGQVQRFERVQLLALQLHHLVGLVQRLQLGEAGAGANVGTQTNAHAKAFHLLQIEQAAAQEQVGGGAEGHRRAGFAEALAFVVAQVHAVGEHRARADQAVVVVDVQVALALGEQLAHPFDLLAVLGEVGMHVEVRVFLEQLAGQRQLLRRAGRGEARGDGVVQAALAVPAFDQRLAVGVAGFGGVGQVVRRVAVHQYLAGDHPQVALFAGIEEGVHRFLVHTAEHQRGGGAVAQQFLEKHLGDFAGVRGVAEGALGGEGVGIEPVQQLLAVGSDHAGLRIVDMGVDETGRDQRVRVLDHLGVGRQAGQQLGRGADLRDLAVLDDQQAVFEVFVG